MNTVWPDFTNPQTVDYWTRMLKSLHDQVPFDGAWIDMNEPSNMISGSFNGCPSHPLEYPPYLPTVDGGKLSFKTVCMTARHFAGIHYNVHNLYGFTEAIVTSLWVNFWSFRFDMFTLSCVSVPWPKLEGDGQWLFQDRRFLVSDIMLDIGVVMFGQSGMTWDTAYSVSNTVMHYLIKFSKSIVCEFTNIYFTRKNNNPYKTLHIRNICL